MMPSILTVDKLETVSGSRLISNFPSGMVIGSAIIRSSARTSISVAQSGILFSGTYTKILGALDSYLIIRSSIFGAQFSSGNCGTGVRVDSTWDYGAAYQYDGAWSGTEQTTVIWGYHVFTGFAAGARTVGFGWNTADGSSNDRPFAILNPNSSDDVRNQQMISSMLVQEITL